MDPAEIAVLIGELEQRVERLRSLYDQYFMGIERLEPTIQRKDVDRRLWALRREQIRNTGLRFKLETTIQRYNTYQQYWQRIVREIENGTYQRDLGRAAQRFGENAVTAFAKRRQKMFEKGQVKKAERDAQRRDQSSIPPPATAAPEPPGESYDVAFDDSDMFADQPPLSLDLASSSESPAKAASPQGAASPVPPAARAPLPSAPAAPEVRQGPAVPSPPTRRSSRPAVKLTAVSRGTLPTPRPAPPDASFSKPATPRPRPPASSQPDARPPAPSQPEVRATAPSKPDARPPTPSKPEIRAGVDGGSDEGLSANRLRQIYGQYVDAKRKANESTAAITFDKVAANLRATADQLKAKHKRAIDFEVVLKNGKPVLKPIVKG